MFTGLAHSSDFGTAALRTSTGRFPGPLTAHPLWMKTVGKRTKKLKISSVAALERITKNEVDAKVMLVVNLV